MVEFFIKNWKELTASFTGLFIFLVGRGSAKKKESIDAVDSMQKTYDVFLKHYTDQYNTIIQRLTDMELRNAILLESSREWEYKFKDLEKLYEKLKKDFDNYKNKHTNDN